MIIALLLLTLLLQRLVTRETHVSLLALIAVCAVQSAILALVQYYGIAVIRPFQPLIATLIPPVAWLAFQQAALEGTPKFWWAHGMGPLLALALLLWQPMLLDVMIPLSFGIYGVAMLVRLSQGEDSLPHSRLESGWLPLLAWRIIALSLIASAACDVWIAYQIASGQTGSLLLVPSIVSSLSLLSLGAVALSHAIESRRDDGPEARPPSAEEDSRDQAIIAKLDEYVTANRPYLDPDLTLARLSRRLVVPAKQLSSAINRVKGENVSRYINRKRIEEACRLLAEGHNVTSAMLESGFNTKSNFNREFLRIRKMPPREWLATQNRLGEDTAAEAR
jgi:AraC-like DNA-binding protein